MNAKRTVGSAVWFFLMDVLDCQYDDSVKDGTYKLPSVCIVRSINTLLHSRSETAPEKLYIVPKRVNWGRYSLDRKRENVQYSAARSRKWTGIIVLELVDVDMINKTGCTDFLIVYSCIGDNSLTVLSLVARQEPNYMNCMKVAIHRRFGPK